MNDFEKLFGQHSAGNSLEDVDLLISLMEMENMNEEIHPTYKIHEESLVPAQRQLEPLKKRKRERKNLHVTKRVIGVLIAATMAFTIGFGFGGGLVAAKWMESDPGTVVASESHGTVVPTSLFYHSVEDAWE